MKNKIIFKTLMLKGEAGSTIVSMEKTGHVGTADIYTITFNDGSTTEISLENMSAITSVEKTSSTDTEDIYTITCADGSTQTFSVLNHNADIAAMSDDIDTIDARVDNFINSVVPNTVETLWTGSIKDVGDSATLSKAVSNFDYIDLYLLGSADSKYIRVPATQTAVTIQQQNLSDDASSNFLRLWEMGVSISGTTVSITKSIAWAWDDPDNSNPTVTANAQNSIPITRIDGVKVASDTPAEVTDIRVGADGMTYNSAGDAVRGQINNVENEIKSFGTQDIINLYGAEEETGFVQSDGTVATNGSWANYSTGTIVLDAGTYTIYGYTQNYTVSGSRYGIAIINGGNVETYKNAYLTDNKEVITLAGRRIVKISATSDVKKMVTSGDGIRPYATYDPRFILSNDLTHQLINNVYGVNFELGSINDPGGVPTFVSDNHRVRTAQPIDLVSGDVIGLTDYENAEFCVFWQNELGGYANTVYYLREDYVVRFSGKYWICIRGIPETLITQISQLWGLLKIVKSGNQFGAHIHKTNAILGVNHRGFSANKRFPENTLIAFKASKLFGFDAVETDVAFTSDNVPVLLHDATINRTARNIDGTEISTDIDIGTITYAQALEYDFGLYAQSAYAGTKIPTFEQFISLCKNIDLHPFIELKDNNGVQYDQSLILGLVDIVDSYGMGKNVTWTSFNRDYLRWISEYKPDAELQLNVFTVTARAVEIVTDELMTGENIVIIASQSFTDNEIEMCSDAKVPLGVYTLNTPEQMETTPEYATYVTSDTINASEYFYNKDISLT